MPSDHQIPTRNEVAQRLRGIMGSGFKDTTIDDVVLNQPFTDWFTQDHVLGVQVLLTMEMRVVRSFGFEHEQLNDFLAKRMDEFDKGTLADFAGLIHDAMIATQNILPPPPTRSGEGK
jgi:hypothetical protein